MEKNREEVELHPTYQVFSRVIGRDAAEKIGQVFGGATIYFPRLDALTNTSRKERDEKIVADYESGQYTKEQLGRKYKLCATGITSVVKRVKAHSTPSEVAIPHGDALIEQIRQRLDELDEEGRRKILKYALKKKSSSRS